MKIFIDSIAINNSYPRLIHRGLDTYLYYQGKEEKIIYNSHENKIELLDFLENSIKVPESRKFFEEKLESSFLTPTRTEKRKFFKEKLESSYPDYRFNEIALTPRSSKTSEEIILEYLQNHASFLKNNEFGIHIIDSLIFVIFKNELDNMIYRRIY